jgi:hypothetical protein
MFGFDLRQAQPKNGPSAGSDWGRLEVTRLVSITNTKIQKYTK